MELAREVSGTTRLVGQYGKLKKLIGKKISDHMESNQPSFTISS